MAFTDWADLTLARALWRDAPADDTLLRVYLDAAQAAVIAYAPDEDAWSIYEQVPELPFALAQVMQARSIYNANQASPSGAFDGSGYGLTTVPLDWQVKQLLRPQRGLGAIA